MALRVGFVLVVVAGSEALTSSQMFRPKLPCTRPVVASLEAAANLEVANLETAPRRQRAPNLKGVELVASTDTANVPWLGRLNKVSNVASILCAIDCTVFPVLLTLLPILNMGSSGKYEVMLHALSHKVALYFVAPVGGLAVTTNFLQHRKPLVLLWGVSGLSLVLLANLRLAFLPHSVDHQLHEWHSVINVMGCLTLLSSQWYAHRLLHEMGKDCGHNHGPSGYCASRAGHDLLKPP